jgi:hypothetical protein
MLHTYLTNAVFLLSGLGFWCIFVPYWIYSRKMFKQHLQSPEYKAERERKFVNFSMLGRLFLTVCIFQALALFLYIHLHAQDDTLILLIAYLVFIVVQLHAFHCVFKSRNPIYFGRLRKILVFNPFFAVAYCLLFAFIFQYSSGSFLSLSEFFHTSQRMPSLVSYLAWPVGEAIWSVAWLISMRRWIGNRQKPVAEPVQDCVLEPVQQPFQKTVSGLRIEDIASGTVLTEGVEESLQRYRAK